MTTILKEPTEILVDFLRRKLPHPDTDFYSDKTETFNVTTTTNTLDLSTGINDKIYTILSVDKNTNTQHRYTDYVTEIPREQIHFASNLVNGDTVEVEYRTVTKNWIDKPYSDFKRNKDNYPILTVEQVAGTGNRSGNQNTTILRTGQFQITVYVKKTGSSTKDEILSVDGRKYSEQNLAHVLARRAVLEIEENIEDLYPVLHTYQQTEDVKPNPYDNDSEAYSAVTSISLDGTDTGKIKI